MKQCSVCCVLALWSLLCGRASFAEDTGLFKPPDSYTFLGIPFDQPITLGPDQSLRQYSDSLVQKRNPVFRPVPNEEAVCTEALEALSDKEAFGEGLEVFCYSGRMDISEPGAEGAEEHPARAALIYELPPAGPNPRLFLVWVRIYWPVSPRTSMPAGELAAAKLKLLLSLRYDCFPKEASDLGAIWPPAVDGSTLQYSVWPISSTDIIEIDSEYSGKALLTYKCSKWIDRVERLEAEKLRLSLEKAKKSGF